MCAATTLSISGIKSLLLKRGVDFSGCVERSELEAKLAASTAPMDEDDNENEEPDAVCDVCADMDKDEDLLLCDGTLFCISEHGSDLLSDCRRDDSGQTSIMWSL